MWEASLNLAISIQSSSSLASSTADGRLAPPNLAVISFGRRSSSDKHPASSNSFMIGLSACTKASAFLLGTRYKKTEQYAIALTHSLTRRALFRPHLLCIGRIEESLLGVEFSS